MAALAPPGFNALPLSIAQLSLAAVLQCGQSFRWSIFPLAHASAIRTADPSAPTHEYRLCLRDRVVCLRQSPDMLYYRSVFPESPSDTIAAHPRDAETLLWLKDYFQLDIDLIKLYGAWSSRDPVFHNLKERFSGVRMLRQDPFENLLSFICSSNNNISRITKMVKNLCQHYSPPLVVLQPPDTTLGLDGLQSSGESLSAEPYHPFPPPSVLAAPEVTAKLRALGFGYRADFIQKTAKMLVDAHGVSKADGDYLEPAERWLVGLREMSTSDAREELLRLMGVGRKVADCILLMSLDKREVIPVDTHVYQIAVKHYSLRVANKTKTMTPKLYDEVSTKLAAMWGDYAGWAHSVLFTSDLKSFSSYGLPTPSPSPSPSPSIQSEPIPLQETGSGRTTLPTPSSSEGKRKRITGTSQARSRMTISVAMGEAGSCLPTVGHSDSEGSGLADRVKRRRRVKAATEVSATE